MTLLVFDIGTLTETIEPDGRFFLEALQAVAGPLGPLPPWEDFAEVTEPAIARVVITQAAGRMAREGEVFQVRQKLAARWQQALSDGEVHVPPVPGAIALLAEARARKGLLVALASGGWGPGTLLKLHAAGFPTGDLTIATADDAEDRAAILQTAAIYATAARGVPGLASFVVVGGAVWDARAARAVQAGFIGIAKADAQTLRLRTEGAAAVLPDFSEPAQFWAAFEAAIARQRATAGN